MENLLGSTSFNEVYEVDSKWFPSPQTDQSFDINVPTQGLQSASNTWDLVPDRKTPKSSGSTTFSPSNTTSTPELEVSSSTRAKRRAAEDSTHCASTFLFAMTLTPGEEELIKPIAAPSHAEMDARILAPVNEDENEVPSLTPIPSLSNSQHRDQTELQRLRMISDSDPRTETTQILQEQITSPDRSIMRLQETLPGSCGPTDLPAKIFQNKADQKSISKEPVQPRKRRRIESANRRSSADSGYPDITGDLEVDLGLESDEDWRF